MEKNLIPVAMGNLVTTNPCWLVEKEQEVQKGEEALEVLKRIPGISKTRLARVRSRIVFLKRYVGLLKEGFIPIPRMEYDALEIPATRAWDRKPHMYLDRMPIEALKNIAEFRNKFDTIGLIRPRAKKRDPILIGILTGAYQEEHFILYFWRPELYSDSEIW